MAYDDPKPYVRPLCAVCGVRLRRIGRPTCDDCGRALVEAQYERLRAQHAGDARDVRPPPPPAPVPPSEQPSVSNRATTSFTLVGTFADFTLSVLIRRG
jgi:hypothetical protein